MCRLFRLRRYSSGGSLQVDVNDAYDRLGRRGGVFGNAPGFCQYQYRPALYQCIVAIPV